MAENLLQVHVLNESYVSLQIVTLETVNAEQASSHGNNQR